jgi:catechol 2,3-dioxygenase-like lactoylglutathione lyase family enzyme
MKSTGILQEPVAQVQHPVLTPELHCTHFKTSLAFYVNILGFHIQYQRVDEGFAMLERQGAYIMIDEIKKEPSDLQRNWLPAPLEHPFGRGVNLEIRTREITALYQVVQHAGAQIFLPMEDKWYRMNKQEVKNRQFIVLDPDGYLLRFSERIETRGA